MGAALFSKKPIIVVDGDGAALMRLGSYPMICNEYPKNLLHILLDNEEHNSTGGQSTISGIMNWPLFAESIGYNVIEVRTADQLKHAISQWSLKKELTFIYMPINNKSKSELGRPKVKPKEVALRFEKYLQS